MALPVTKNVAFPLESHKLLIQLRDKLKKETGVWNISLAEAANLAIKKELARLDTDQQTQNFPS